MSSPAPTYRYHSVPPTEVRLRLADFEIPESLKAADFDPERPITVPCGDLFAGPVAAVRMARFCELVPSGLAPDLLDEGMVRVRAGALALHYALATVREDITPPEAESPSTEVDASAADVAEAGISAEQSPASFEHHAPEPAGQVGQAAAEPAAQEKHRKGRSIFPLLRPRAVALPKAAQFPPAPVAPVEANETQEAPVAPEPHPAIESAPTAETVNPAHTELDPPTETAPAAEAAAEAAPEAVAEVESLPEAAAMPEPLAAPEAAVMPAEEGNRSGILPVRRRPFSASPMVRRKRVSEAAQPLPAEDAMHPPQGSPRLVDTVRVSLPRRATALPEPTPEPAPQAEESDAIAPHSEAAPALEPELASPAAEEVPLRMEASAEPAAPDPMPEPYEPGEASATDVGHEVIPAVSPPVLHVEPVGNVEQSLECEPRLQEIFMTEETIGLERAVELCGGLPGIRACILAKGSNVLAAHNAPPHLDLVSLTANAAAMVEAVRSSALRMGLGEIPAVTAHSESGPISFFHASDLALLVLHSDRGFVPGVRERLRDVLLAMGTSGVSLRLGAGDRG